jgi:hypothetical protein
MKGFLLTSILTGLVLCGSIPVSAQELKAGAAAEVLTADDTPTGKRASCAPPRWSSKIPIEERSRSSPAMC